MRKVVIFLLLIVHGICFGKEPLRFDVAKYPFSCRGAYLSVFKLSPYTNWGASQEKDGLYIRNISGRSLYDRMIRIDVVEEDRVVEPKIIATPEMLELKTSRGSAKICFETPSVLRIKTDGVTLRLKPHGSSFLLRYGEDRLRLLNGTANDFFYMISSLRGNLEHKGELVKGKEKTHPNLFDKLSIQLEPDEKNNGEFAIEEFQSEWRKRSYDIPFEVCLANMRDTYETWEQRFDCSSDADRLAAYVSWSCLVSPRGMMKREGMYMSKNWMNMIWSWDHCFNAMAMSSIDPEVSWNQMMCIFDHQNEIGALPDSFDDIMEYWGIVKTPIHGWALRYLMNNCSWIKDEHLREIYEPLCRWTDFWFIYRDYDSDGIPQYNHSYESFDDTTPLDAGFPLEAPELATFLILQLDVLSDVAERLGKIDEAVQWEKRSSVLKEKMIQELWNGERFVARRLETGEWNKGTIDFLQYVPLLLGDKLPEDIREKMLKSFKASGLVTLYGIATESPQSPFFNPDSYTRGSIWAPINIFLIDGLRRCGEISFAQRLKERYCRHMAKKGFPERFCATDGELRSDPEYTWTSSVYLILSDYDKKNEPISFDPEVTVDYRSMWDSVRVLENPHKGWYQHLLDNQIIKYQVKDMNLFDAFPGMDHVYIRIAWSFLEPEEGKYDWRLIDEVVDKYVTKGYGVSFAITSKETGKCPIVVGQEKDGVQYATPAWVREAGAKGVETEAEGARSWSPDWDDPIYLEKLDAFQKAFANRYDGQPWVRYVDIASIGEWGEGHTSASTNIPPTVEEVKKNMDVYLRHFKESLIVSTDDLLYYGKPEDEVDSLYRYAVDNGMSVRDDSPMVDWYLQRNLDTWSVSHPKFYDPLYKTKPIIVELQHYGMVKNEGNWIGKNGEHVIPKYGYSGADIVRNTIRTMHATYIGFHGFMEEWYADNPDLSRELANLCGYWYFPVQASIGKVLGKGENQLSISWQNRGVAPAYNTYSLVVRLINEQTGDFVDRVIPDSGNRKWLPDKVYPEIYSLDIPDSVTSGYYTLAFKLQYIQRQEREDVDLGVTEEVLKDRYVPIGRVYIK